MLSEKEVARVGMILAAKLKERREELGISKNALAQSAGLAMQTISFLESGAHSPSVATLLRICAALEIAPDQLLKAALKDSVG